LTGGGRHLKKSAKFHGEERDMGDMIYQKLVDLIQDNADQLTKRLMRDILSREETKSYKTLPEKEVYWRVFDVYSRLDSWLSKDKEKG